MVADAAAATPDPLLAAFARVLERLIARALALDPETQARLAPLEGHRIVIEAHGTPLAASVIVRGGKVELGPALPDDAALRVGGSPGAWLSLALRRARGDPALPSALSISGDAELARQMQVIAVKFAPDIDEAFAGVFGDVAGTAMARTARAAAACARDAAGAFAQDAAAFLTDETRDLVARAELDEFLDGVDELDARVERLAARIARLRAVRTAGA